METSFEHKLSLFLGPYRSGKSDALVKEILSHCRSHVEGALIVVPSKRYGSVIESKLDGFLRKENEQQANTTFGVAGIRIVTFYEYCQLVLGRCGSFPRVLQESARLKVVETVLKEATEHGDIDQLAKIAHFPGTARAILQLLDEFERAALSPHEVTTRLAKTAAQGTRYREIATLYERYWKKLDDIDYLDERRVAFRILDKLSTSTPHLPQLVAFDGFDRLNPLQLQVIAAGLTHISKTYLTFDYLPPEEDVKKDYEWKIASFAQLHAILGAQLCTTVFKAARNKDEILQVEAFTSAERYMEMGRCAAMVKEALSKDNLPPEQVLVVMRSTATYGQAIESAFEDAGVPCFLDQAIQLNSLPIVRFILSILSLGMRAFPRAEVIRCLQSPFFYRKNIGISEEEIKYWDVRSRDGKVITGVKAWQEALSESPTILKLISLFSTLSIPDTVGDAYEFVEWCEDLLDRFLHIPSADQSIVAKISPVSEYEQWEIKSAIAQVRKCFASMLQEQNIASALGASSSLSFDQHFAKLKSLVDNANFKRIAREKNHVLICSADLAPNRKFEQVFIAGMIEGEFPRRQSRGGFVSSEEIARWKTYQIDLHNPRFEPSFEPALLNSLFERARTKVTLSAPRFEMDGDELTAAFLFSQLIEDGKTKVLPEEHFQVESRRPSSARNAIAALYWSLADADAELPISIERHPATQDLLANLAGPRSVVQARARVDLKSPLNGNLSEHVLAGTLKIGLPEHFSASQLGDFGKCPFKYWLSRLLRTELPIEPEEGLTPMERGTLYHRALEIFYAGLIAKDQSIVDLGEERGAVALQAIEQALSETEKQSHFRAGEFWQYQKRELIFRLTRFIDAEHERSFKQNQKWKPVAVEQSFGSGKEGASPPLRLRGGAIAVRGQIDRIDRAFIGSEPTNQFRVVDYKTGSAAISALDHNEGRSLQLPLYAMAIQKAIFPGAKVEEGEYLSVSSGGKIGSLFPLRRRGEDPDAPPIDVLGQSERLIDNFVDSIAAGQFIVNPSNQMVCKSCDHKPVCRVAEMAFEEEFSG